MGQRVSGGADKGNTKMLLAVLLVRSLLLLNLLKSGSFGVSADVILTHLAGVKLTHLGEYGGFLAADNVDPGASSGDQGINATRCWDSGDGAGTWMLSKYDPALSA